MRKDLRFRSAALFNQVYEEGKTTAVDELVLYSLFLNNKTPTRVGFSLSKKVGIAVVRNKIKRRLASIVEAKADTIKPGYALVIIGRPRSARVAYKELENSVSRLFQKAGIIGRS